MSEETKRERTPLPTCKLSEDGRTLQVTEHELNEDSKAFLDRFYMDLGNMCTKGRKLDETAINYAMTVIEDVKPRDRLESLLAAQMFAVHSATVALSRRLLNCETIAQQDSNARALVKLGTLYTRQLEVLHKRRGGTKQKVEVKHVHVHEGGQAVVGNVTHGGGGE